MEVGILIVLFGLVLVLVVRYLRKRRNLPPGPFNYPLIGCLRIVRAIKRRRPYIVLKDIAQEHGPIYSFRLGQQLVVYLHGYDVIHDALVKQAEVFSNRPNHLPLLKRFLKNGCGIVFSNYNHNWKVLRRFTQQALKDLGVGKSMIEEKIMTEIEAITIVFVQHDGRPVDMHACLHMMTGNMVYGIVFGKRYDYDDPQFDNVRLLTTGFFDGDGALNVVRYLPEVIIRVILAVAKRISLEDRQSVFRKADAIIEEILSEHEATFDENSIRDFVDLYIKTSRSRCGDDSHVFTRKELKKVILDLFVAGSETTSLSLDWAFLYMAEFPEVQKRCQEEIDEAFGDRPIRYTDREKLPYVNATLMEAQRISVTAPLALVHCTSKDTVLYGYNIPADTVIIPSLHSACNDPKYWTEPEVFRPDRFFDSNGKLIKFDAFIPFSIGPRQCLGEPLAKMEMFLFFANLLQKFNFKRENDAVRHSLKSKSCHSTNVPEQYRLRVHSRRDNL